MRVSIITVLYNSADTIEDTFKSVAAQDYEDIEYIVVDGASTDGTLDIIKKYAFLIDKWISEPDEGIYYALNKGIKMATGEIVGILHSNDLFASSDVLSTIVKKMTENQAGVCWGDIVYVSQNDVDTIQRVWKSSEYEIGKFELGWHPPHPTFYAKKELYEKLGYFNTDFKIAADYELMLRFIEKNKASSCYVSKILVKMRTGGISNKNLKNIIKANVEVYKAWKVNGLEGGLLVPLLKPFSKIVQYFKTRNAQD